MCWEALEAVIDSAEQDEAPSENLHTSTTWNCVQSFSSIFMFGCILIQPPTPHLMPHASSINTASVCFVLGLFFGGLVTICTGLTAVFSHQNVTCITSAALPRIDPPTLPVPVASHITHKPLCFSPAAKARSLKREASAF